MENRPIIKKEQVETVYDSRFIKVFDLNMSRENIILMLPEEPKIIWQR